MRRRSVLAAIACAAIVAGACSSYDEDKSKPEADAGASGSLNDAATTPEAAPDADAAVDADAAPAPVYGHADEQGLYPNCPPTKPATDYTAGAAQLILAGAPEADRDADYPFAIATDATHVYWVSQLAKRGDDAENSAAYNGGGTRGRVHRVAKSGHASWNESVIVTSDQSRVAAIALDGDSIYWTVSPSDNQLSLQTVARSCVAPCVPVVFTSLAGVPPVWHMRRLKPGVLALLARDGQLFTLDLATKQVAKANASGPANSWAVRSDDIFLSDFSKANIGRVDLVSGGYQSSFATFPADTAALGPSQIATDCRSLFTYRNSDKSVWASDITTPSFARIGDPLGSDTFDMTADAEFVYLAGANTGGVSAMATATKKSRVLLNGAFWHVVSDDTGVYAAAHAINDVETGTMYRLK